MFGMTFKCAKCHKYKEIAGRKAYKVTGTTVNGRKRVNYKCEDCCKEESECMTKKQQHTS